MGWRQTSLISLAAVLVSHKEGVDVVNINASTLEAFIMRTTLDIDDELLAAAREIARR